MADCWHSASRNSVLIVRPGHLNAVGCTLCQSPWLACVLECALLMREHRSSITWLILQNPRNHKGKPWTCRQSSHWLWTLVCAGLTSPLAATRRAAEEERVGVKRSIHNQLNCWHSREREDTGNWRPNVRPNIVNWYPQTDVRVWRCLARCYAQR